MASSTQSACPPPFLDLSNFPYTGGEQQSRFCAPIDQDTTCCLPCPVTDWVYPDNFNTVTTAANWLGLSSFVCCIILLLSFLVLPVRKTSRHYLTVCLVLGVGCMTFAFVISLAARPQQCHDAVTPNNMESDLACAFSGSFVLFGGMAGAVWIFIRSLSLHLQICWQIVPGKKFFYASLVGGWGCPLLFMALSLALSGVSYRFGPICHINHDYSLGTFWGPVLSFTGLAAACQFATLGYCIRVYLRSLMDTAPTSATSSTAASGALPSVHGSFKTVSARAAYRRVRKVIALQWRGVMVVVILIVTATYFSVVFLKLDSASVATQKDPTAALPWLTCLYLTGGDKNECLGQIGDLILNEPTVATCLYLIAFMGFWCVFFLGRWSMVPAWWELISSPFRDTDNWVSADARRLSDPRNYEMLTAPPQQYYMSKGPSGLVATASVINPEKTPAPGHASPPPMAGRMAARNFSPSSRDHCLVDDSDSTIERTLSKSSLQMRPTRSGSQNTARVTFTRDTPTPIPATTASPRSQSSAEYYTPRTYTSPTSAPGNQDYFSRPRTSSRTGTEHERNLSAVSRSQSTSTRQRDWYGQGVAASPYGMRDTEQQPPGGSSFREWDPQSTFARSNSTQQ